PQRFEAFANDRFAFRTQMAAALNKAKYKLFGVTDCPTVLVGNDGWLFYLGQGEEETMRHTRPFSHSELAAWASHFEARRAWLAERNIEYLVFIAPSKAEIYPEMVPKVYTHEYAESRQDQLLDALNRYTKVRCLDLRQSLYIAKSEMPWPLYYKTDTHW